MEHQAVTHEMIILRRIARERSTALLEGWYEDIDPIDWGNYRSLCGEIDKRDLWKLEPLMYFIALNQAIPGDLAWNHGEYITVRAVKRILANFPVFSDMGVPSNDEDVKNAVNFICESCSLRNPFHNLQLLLDLRDSEEVSTGPTVVLTSRAILRWIVEHPYQAIYWPKDPGAISALPIINVRDQNVVMYTSGAGLTGEIGQRVSLEHRDYGWLIHVLGELFHKATTRCPGYLHRKPRICDSCEECSGNLPEGFRFQDCPIRSMLVEQGIDFSGWEL